MYCDVDKAFDNPTEYQMRGHNNGHMINNKHSSFFTAQGNLGNMGNMGNMGNLGNLVNPSNIKNLNNVGNLLGKYNSPLYTDNNIHNGVPIHEEHVVVTHDNPNADTYTNTNVQVQTQAHTPIPKLKNFPDNFKGTSITDIKNKFNDNDSISVSLLNLDSESYDNFYFKQKPKKNVKYPHQYYIKKFIQDITNDDDILSQTSSRDDLIYNHVRKCKYCKTQINHKMKNYYNNIFIKDADKKNEKDKQICIERFESNFEQKPKCYELREVIVIILIGIIIIFMLDLFFKMSKLMKKYNV